VRRFQRTRSGRRARYYWKVITRVATLLVLFAALLQASPVVPPAISIRLAAAIVFSADEARDEQPERAGPPHRRAIVDSPAPRAHYVAADLAFALFQRPPPFTAR